MGQQMLHAKCLKSWERWDTHGTPFFDGLGFRSPALLWGSIDSPIWGSHYFGGVTTLRELACCLVVLPAPPPY